MFDRSQYPFVGYTATVKALKRDLDRAAKSRYPMVARVTDAKGQVLSDMKYTYVHDRKPAYTEFVYEPWEAPVTVQFVDLRDELLGEITLEKVFCQAPEIQLEVDWSQHKDD